MEIQDKPAERARFVRKPSRPKTSRTGRRAKRKRIKRPHTSAATTAQMAALTPEQREHHLARLQRGREVYQAAIKEYGLPHPKCGLPWGQRKSSSHWKRKVAHGKQMAKEGMELFEQEGIVPVDVVPGSDDEKAKKALEIAMQIACTPYSPKDRLSACNIVLNFTKSKPAIKQDLRVNNAEAWLNEVMDDAGLTPKGSKGEAS